MYLAKVLQRGTRRIDRHPEFLAYLRSLPEKTFEKIVR